MMYTEFSVSLVVSVLLAGIIIWLLVKRLRINRNKSNKIAVLYLLPVTLTALLLAVIIWLVIPRAMDIPNVISGNFDVVETELTEDMLVKTGIVVDKQHYFLLAKNQVKPGGYVRLYVTPNAGYVMRVDILQIETPDE